MASQCISGQSLGMSCGPSYMVMGNEIFLQPFVPFLMEDTGCICISEIYILKQTVDDIF